MSSRPPSQTAAVVPSSERRAAATTITLSEDSTGSIERIAAALPDPDELAPGTLVVVPGAVASRRSFAQSVLAVFGRAKTIGRAHRCSALLARGYVEIGAADDERGTDLAWGSAPSPPA